MKKSVASPAKVSTRKILHSLGPPQESRSALLPVTVIARNPSEGVWGLLSRTASVMLAQAPLEEDRKAPLGTGPRLTPCLLPRCKEAEQTSKQRLQYLSQNGYGISLSLSPSSSPGHEGSVKPPGHLAPQLLLGLSEGVKSCFQYWLYELLPVTETVPLRYDNMIRKPKVPLCTDSVRVGTPRRLCGGMP